MAVLSVKYIVKWAYAYLRKYASHIILILLWSLTMIILNLFQVNYIQRIIDAAIQKQWIFVSHTVLGFIFINLLKMLRNYFLNIFPADWRLRSAVISKEDWLKNCL